MGRRNAFLEKMKRQEDAICEKQRLFSTQMCRDFMVIAVHNEFGFGEERCRKLLKVFDEVALSFSDSVLEDAKTDRKMWYAKEKLDEALREIIPDYPSWDERYRKLIG